MSDSLAVDKQLIEVLKDLGVPGTKIILTGIDASARKARLDNLIGTLYSDCSELVRSSAPQIAIDESAKLYEMLNRPYFPELHHGALVMVSTPQSPNEDCFPSMSPKLSAFIEESLSLRRCFRSILPLKHTLPKQQIPSGERKTHAQRGAAKAHNPKVRQRGY